MAKTQPSPREQLVRERMLKGLCPDCGAETTDADNADIRKFIAEVTGKPFQPKEIRWCPKCHKLIFLTNKVKNQ